MSKVITLEFPYEGTGVVNYQWNSIYINNQYTVAYQRYLMDVVKGKKHTEAEFNQIFEMMQSEPSPMQQVITPTVSKPKRAIKNMSEMFVFLTVVVRLVFGTFFIVTWLAGIVIAKGFWFTLFSIFPFYSWYLVVEKAMIYYHLI